MGDLNNEAPPTCDLLIYVKGGTLPLSIGVVDREAVEKLLFETIACYYAAPFNDKPTDLTLITLPATRFDRPMTVVTPHIVAYTFLPIPRN
jgi:hypothetical protein